MTSWRRHPLTGAFTPAAVAWLSFSIGAFAAGGWQKDDKDSRDKDSDKKPKLTLKAQPMISMSPSKVTLRAELVGGANDYQDYYCPTVEWDWGDGTHSESTSDCEPYRAGEKRNQAALHSRARVPRRLLSGGDSPEAPGQGSRDRDDDGAGSSWG